MTNESMRESTYTYMYLGGTYVCVRERRKDDSAQRLQQENGKQKDGVHPGRQRAAPSVRLTGLSAHYI